MDFIYLVFAILILGLFRAIPRPLPDRASPSVDPSSGMQTASIVLFLLSAGLLFYITLGYPILVALHRGSGAAIRKKFVPRSVSVLIVVHNGEAFVRGKLESVLALDYPRELMEILVVSDGSTDATEGIITEFAARGVQMLRLPRGGKAAALNAAIPRLHGDLLVLTDVRQTLAADSLRALVSCFADPNVGAVSAELRILEGERREESDMGLYWRYEVWMRQQMSRIFSTFGANGPYYAMRRELAEPMPADTLLDDVVMVLPGLFKRLSHDTRTRCQSLRLPHHAQIRIPP